MHVVAPGEASKCRSKGTKDEWIERTYVQVIVSGIIKGKILQMEVVEDFESRPQKTLSFVGRNGADRSCRCCVVGRLPGRVQRRKAEKKKR